MASCEVCAEDPMIKNEKSIAAGVGNLPKGYIRNVPLPRVPRDQSTFQSRVPPVRHTLPRYYKDTHAIPMYSDTYRIGERVA